MPVGENSAGGGVCKTSTTGGDVDDFTRVGAELFGWTIVLAALAMAADWMVANRFYAPREEVPQAGDVVAEFDEALAEEDQEPAWADAASEPPPLPSRDRGSP